MNQEQESPCLMNRTACGEKMKLWGACQNGPIQVNNRIQDVYTKPTAPRNELETVTIAANARIEIRLQFYVPGLITIGQQLILESLVP